MQAILNTIVNTVLATLNTYADKVNELGKPRDQINNLCDTNTICRPHFLLEKNMTVLRKGPTMPLTLEMYQYEDQLAAVNTITEGTAVTATFNGNYMDKSSNFVNNPSTDQFDNSLHHVKGTAVDGVDISIFYTKGKVQKKAGDTLVIPINIESSGEDWKNQDQLIITHEWVDIFGKSRTATCKCEIINAKQTRWIDDGSGGEDWMSPEWSPYRIHGPADASGDWKFPNGAVIPGNTATYGAYNLPGMGVDKFVYARVVSMADKFPITGTTGNDLYSVELVQSEPLFRVKFPKFSYRYKYEDGEYSVFAPWSEVAFIPGEFDYSPKKGYNLGMQNYLRLLKVLNWRPKNCPPDVVQIDILYKESNSPNIYTVESFKKDDPAESGESENYWNTKANGGHYGKYTIKTEMIHKVVASNQMLRPWDNVPRKALAQEITANRLIYANYLQQYDIEKIDPVTNDRISIKPEFDVSITSLDPWEDDDTELGFPAKSLKSQRTYQLGVVYRDKYGRETPILTSQSGSVDIKKPFARLQNRLNVELKNDAPYWAESYTFYVKETSNEYYNIAMDRWYDAEDGGVWLSFPSSERNKISEDTNLILKKKHDSHNFTDLDVSYKVLAIDNNAPNFIKTQAKYWGSVPIMLPPPGWGDVGSWDTGMLHPSGLPLPNRMNVDVIAEYFDATVLKGLTESSSGQIRITQTGGMPSAYNSVTSESVNNTDWYDIANISYIGAPPQTYFDDNGNEQEVEGTPVRIARIALERAFGVDALFCESDSALQPTMLNTSSSNLSMSRGLSLEARTVEKRDSSKFEGRFFVKILRDANVEANIVQSQLAPADEWQVIHSKDIKYISVAHPGRQDWNYNKYIDPQIDWSNNSPDTRNYFVSSLAKTVNNMSATYVDSSGQIQDGPNLGVKYWPFGPHGDTNGVFYTPGPDGNYWNNVYKDYLTPQKNFPNYQNQPNDWPSIAPTSWSYANTYGMVYNELNDALDGTGVYSYLTHVAAPLGIKKSGILDLTMGCKEPNASGSGWVGGGNGQTLDGAECNPIWTWERVPGHPYNPQDLPGVGKSKGYHAPGNPYMISAIWGNQEDFVVDGTYNSAWPQRRQPVFNLGTMAKLRQHWYNLWRGRDDIDDSWPLGRFHPDRWFFDKAGAASGGSGNGIWNDGQQSYMHLSFWGIGRDGATQAQSNTYLASRHQPTELLFAQEIGKVGATFRFKQDPDQTIYTVTNVALEDVWNYESPVGSWGYWDRDAEDPKPTGGGGMFKNVLPPYGSYQQGEHLAGGTAFLSDVVMQHHRPTIERARLSGGAVYNRRARYIITLDKVIGAEGPNSFHPITNHVDANGKANVKRGRQQYFTSFGNGITEDVGGTPDGKNFYNLSSYWNSGCATEGCVSNTPATTEDTQPWYTDEGYNTHFADDIAAGTKVTQTWYTDNPNAYIGLHERGLNETTIEIVTQYTGEDKNNNISNNPAIWETEPKEDVGLDIYYAASPSFPIQTKRHRFDANKVGMDGFTGADEVDIYGANWDDYTARGEEIARVGSLVIASGFQDMKVCDVKGDLIFMDRQVQLDDGTFADLPLGSKIRVEWRGEGTYYGVARDIEWVELTIIEDLGQAIYRVGSTTNNGTHNIRHGLGYFNCYSFGTGVESNRIRDDFNAVTIDKGVKASMPLAEQYEEERKGSGLIFSGIYNSTSGINRTNQFIQAEPITKDLNPVNGSIQKLFARDTDLVTFCENKVFKILAKKDALFNADGNTNVTSNQAVLGQSIPFSGEYGISRNPESFASESYRVYFTDKDRGAVLRLSKDGLTPISNAGMKDWFRDNLRYAKVLIGSHDDRDDQYNLTIETSDQDANEKAYTVSYAEKVRGWVSFKSFIQEGGVSHKNIYYTFPSNWYNRLKTQFDPWGVLYGGENNAEVHQHGLDIDIKRLANANTNGGYVIQVYDGLGVILEGMNVFGNGIPTDTRVKWVACDNGLCNVEISNNTAGGVWLASGTEVRFTTARNSFYGGWERKNYSMVKVLFNGDQGSVKRFKTLNYEGSQANILYDSNESLTNFYSIDNTKIGQKYYDNYPKLGWKVHNIFTDLQDGNIGEFIDKENKWFNWIKGNANPGQGDFLDTSEFSVQGLGYSASNVPVIYGCTDPNAGDNYDPSATVDDGSCWAGQEGCMDPSMYNYCITCVVDDGSCEPFMYGCTDPYAFNYDQDVGVNTDDGSCIPFIYGCMDEEAFNYTTPTGSPLLDINTDDGSCVAVVLGCTDVSATNYNPSANTDDGSCNYPPISVYGCTDPFAINYNAVVTVDDGSCIYDQTKGCMDKNAINYDPLATVDSGLCIPIIYGCMDVTAANYDPHANRPDKSCIEGVWGCTDRLAYNFNKLATIDNGTCEYYAWGCMDKNAINYDPAAEKDDDSCRYGPDDPDCKWGCTDPYAFNYLPEATCDDGSCIPYIWGCMHKQALNYDPTANMMNKRECCFCVRERGISFEGGREDHHRDIPSDTRMYVDDANYDPNMDDANYDPNTNHPFSGPGKPCQPLSGLTWRSRFEKRNCLVPGDEIFILWKGGSSCVQRGMDNSIYISYNTEGQAIGSVTHWLGVENTGYLKWTVPEDLVAGQKYYFYISNNHPNFNNDKTEHYYSHAWGVCEEGCTDPSAANYSISATTDDGSCVAAELSSTTLNAPIEKI